MTSEKHMLRDLGLFLVVAANVFQREVSVVLLLEVLTCSYEIWEVISERTWCLMFMVIAVAMWFADFECEFCICLLTVEWNLHNFLFVLR
jgi:hypothetical protein